MNASYHRKIVSDEFRETLIFCGLVNDYHCKTKEKDSKGATRYSFDTKLGNVYVYAPNAIYIHNKKFNSLYAAKEYIGKQL
jgi:hypothetical protein